MNKVILTLVSASFFLNMPCFANDGKQIYGSMKTLEGEWVLSSTDKQEGKATKHKLVAPLVGTDAVGMSFKLVGKGSTVQEILLPETKKEMVSMYHCNDPSCSMVKATHYCVKQNQPEMVADLSSTKEVLAYDCDMSTELCQSGRDHIHKIKHELTSGGNHLKTTYTSWKDGRYLKDSIYHFDRK